MDDSLDKLISSLAKARLGKSQVAQYESQLTEAKVLDSQDGIHIIKAGHRKAGLRENQVLRAYEKFREQWHHTGQDLIHMAAKLPNPDDRKQLLAEINEIYGNDKHPPEGEC